MVESEPGLYFVGRPFLHAYNSHTIGGVGRDAAHVVRHIAGRGVTRPAPERVAVAA